jgi:hypothetical protein
MVRYLLVRSTLRLQNDQGNAKSCTGDLQECKGGDTQGKWPDPADKALPCRPTVACTADIVAPGAFEVETGAFFSGFEDARETTIPILLKQSVTRVVQIQVGSNGYTLTRTTATPTARYFDNVFVGPKLHLVDQGDFLPALAVSAAASLPTFERPGYVRHDDALFAGYVTRDVGPVHADLNFGLNAYRLERNPLAQGWAALALSMGLVHPLGVALEPYVFTDASPAAAKDGGLRGALTLTPVPWLVFDVGADAGAYPSVRAWTLLFGVTAIPIVFWR